MSVHSLNPGLPAPPSAFAPSPDQSDLILSAIAASSLPLAEIASAHHTTIATLCSWLESPAISARLESIENTIARRTRLLAAPHLELAITALSEVLKNALAEERAETATRQPSDPSAPSRDPAPASNSDPAPHQDRTTRRRSEIRKSAALLARLSNFSLTPRAHTPRRNAPPSPRRERPEPTADDFRALLAHVESETRNSDSHSHPNADPSTPEPASTHGSPPAASSDRVEAVMAIIRARPGGEERVASIRRHHLRCKHNQRLDKLGKFLNHPDPAISRRAADAILKLNNEFHNSPLTTSTGRATTSGALPTLLRSPHPTPDSS